MQCRSAAMPQWDHRARLGSMEATVGVKQKSLQAPSTCLALPTVAIACFDLLLHDRTPCTATVCNHETAEMTLLNDHTGDIHTNSQFQGEPACGKH